MIDNPNYQDFATGDESAYPELWDGCVGAWAPCLGPSGLQLIDQSYRKNNLTLTNMDAATDWVSSGGRFALDFDGINDSAQSASVVANGSRFAVSCWVSLRSIATRQGIFAAGVIGNGIYIDVLTTGVIRAAFEFVGGFVFRDSSIALSQNSLQHVCVSWAGASVTIYINGVDLTTGGLLSGSFVQASIASARIATGLSGPPYGGPCNCLVFSCSLYEKTATQNEVDSLYFAGPGGIYLPRRRRRVSIFLGPAFNAAWARGANQFIQPSLIGVA